MNNWWIKILTNKNDFLNIRLYRKNIINYTWNMNCLKKNKKL